MRVSGDDRKTSARIRDCAMELFAQRGAADVSVREVAAAAGVSPGLVMHHFGSKDGLKEAVEHRAAAIVDAMLGDLGAIGDGAGPTSLATLVAERLDSEPALTGYIRRMLLDGGPSANRLFARLFETTVAGIESLKKARIVRSARDERVRAAFLLVNDLAMVLLRPEIENVIGIDPLSGAGLIRWTSEVVDVYTNGVFAAPPSTSKPSGRRHRTPLR